jgi:hypothetical protein
MKRYLMLFAITLLFAPSGFAQGTEGVLRCLFDGELQVHADPSGLSPVVGTVKCGERVFVFDNWFASKHIRTANGTEGFITNLTIGQWILQDAVAPGVPLFPLPGPLPAVAPSPQDPDFRRFEIGVLASYLRIDDRNLGGAELSFVVNLNDRIGLVSAVDTHSDFDPSDIR